MKIRPRHGLNRQFLLEVAKAYYAQQLFQSEYLPDIEDTLGRFRVWAKDLGVFLPSTSQASLDQRLRDGREMGTAIRRELTRNFFGQWKK